MLKRQNKKLLGVCWPSKLQASDSLRDRFKTKVDNRGRQPALTSELDTGVSGYANLDIDVHTQRHTPIHFSNISQDTTAEKFSNSIKYTDYY